METEIVFCRCGKPAKRKVIFRVDHADVNGRGYGSICDADSCCHSLWCFVVIFIKALFSLAKKDGERIRDYGKETDAEIRVPIPDHGD